MITNENYEGYLMRYADGDLSAAEAAEVEAFLDKHPDLREELEDITSPTLRVTPPMVTLPGKERLMHDVAAVNTQSHGKVWVSIAATIALLVVAAGVVRSILLQDDGEVVASRIDTVQTAVSDTVLPDSLYARPEKRLPIYLAETTKDFVLPSEEKNDNPSNQTILEKEAEIQQEFDYKVVPQEFFAENNDSRTTTKGARLVGGRVIVAETDQLVDIIQMQNTSTANPNVTRGLVVENSMLATEEKKSLFGRAVELIAAELQRRTQDPDTLLAYNE